MTKPMNTASIEKATGLSWTDWLEFFGSINASELSHHEIAVHAYDFLAKLPNGPGMSSHRPGGQTTTGWWSQNVTVAYEQHIGRRQPGQRKDGTYEVSVTKTIEGSLDDAMNYWLYKIADLDGFKDVVYEGQPGMSVTNKWRHWRVGLADGSKVIASTMQKTPNKAQLAVANQKLTSPEAVELWRKYWKQFLAGES